MAEGDRTGPPIDAPRLSVVVPAYECADQIGATIGRLVEELEAVVGRGGLEVVVVDDGSADGTGAAAVAVGAHVVLRQPRNRGKGAAVRTGVLAARGAVVAFTDADLAYEPSLLLRLVEAIDGGAAIAIGSRTAGGSASVARPIRALGSRVVNLVARLAVRAPFGDTQCGLKAFRHDVARPIFERCRIDGFAMDIEVLHLAERSGLAVVEVPVTPRATERSTVRLGLDTIRLLLDVARIRWASARGAYDLPATLAGFEHRQVVA